MVSQRVKETGLTVLQICMWSQLGVLVRIYLDKFFVNGCTGGWGLCLLSSGAAKNSLGAYFPDLASNMLGSYVMGFLAAASTLGFVSSKAIGFLPAGHPLQEAGPLLVGMRTGFCGSLTTFSSWQLSLVELLIGGQGRSGGQWADFLWGEILGLQLALSSYAFGLHGGGLLHHYLSHEPKTAVADENAADLGLLHFGDELLECEVRKTDGVADAGDAVKYNIKMVDRPANGDNGLIEPKVRQSDREGDARYAEPDTTVAGETANEEGLLHVGDELLESGSRDRRSSTNGESKDRESQQMAEERGRSRQVLQMDTEQRESESRAKRHNGKLLQLVNLGAAALLTALTALWIVLAVLDGGSSHQARRQQWFALLLGPFGALLRWRLSVLNAGHGRLLPWFPVGTFAANSLACALDFGMQAALRRATGLGCWPVLMLGALRVGLAGSLSTVSTLVAEVHAHLRDWPTVLLGYVYAFATIATGILLGVAIYGWSVWA